MRITQRFFQNIDEGKYKIFISKFVIDEISRADDEKKRKLEGKIKEYNPGLLRPNDEFERLAEKFFQAGFIPERFKTDLFHIAMASVHELDVVVSWNMKHIVKLKTKRYVRSINQLEGYKEIEIVTPGEVIDDD